MSKNKNRIVTYFVRRDIVRPIALGVLILGLLCLWLGWGWISYVFAMLGIPGGLIAYLISAAKTVPHDEIPDTVKARMRDYDRAFTETKKCRTEVLKHPSPIETEAYEYGEGSKYFKKLKDSRVISDVFVKTHIFMTNNELIIVSRRLSLCELDDSGKRGVEDIYEEFTFDLICEAAIDESEAEVVLSDSKKPQRVKQSFFVLKRSEGELIRIAVRNDVELSKFCDEINRKIKSLKQST